MKKHIKFCIVSVLLASIVWLIGGIYVSNNAEAQTKLFTVKKPGTGTSLMDVWSNGNVGIGTTTPSGKLHVYGPAANIYLDRPSASISGYRLLENGSLKASMYLHTDNSLNISSDTAQSLHLRTNAVQRMTITSTGNVGIGTTSPGTALEVNGTITATALSSNGSTVNISDLAALQATVAALQATVDALQQKLQYVSVSGTEMYIDGANLNIRSGAGFTGSPVNGLGNLIVGYNEGSDTRTGSHNLVVGGGHGYTSYGGLVAGYNNTISGIYSSVSGGRNSTASGLHSSVSGGYNNTASGTRSSVSGGYSNKASQMGSSVSGGYSNTASAYYSNVSAGRDNTASGWYSGVSGGRYNEASDNYSVVRSGRYVRP